MKENQAPNSIRLSDYKPPSYLIDTLDLRFELGENASRVLARSSVRRNPMAEPTDTLVLDGVGLELKSLALNGAQVPESRLSRGGERLKIQGVPESFSLEVETELKPQENTTLEGLYKSAGNFCTQCEAQGFRKITYYLDRPDVMAKFSTTLVADKVGYPVLLSNGNLADRGEMDGNRHWVRWEDPFPKPSYLFALVAGDLALVEDRYVTGAGREILLRIYVERHNVDKCQHAMGALQKAMRWDEQKFGLEYDLDSYMIVAVDDFNMGAMENKGLNLFNSKCVLADTATATDADFQAIEGVIGHEYFHNWTGNRVTLRDWFQLSLKEGLTVFRDQEFSADMTSRAVKRISDVRALRARQFPEDAGPTAHPVRPSEYMEINNFYTATVYEKGAEIIRMLHTLLGTDGFRQGMDLYFQRHDGQAVTCDDFVQAMEDATGKDLGQFRLWYAQAGTPVLKVTERYDEQTRRYRLDLKQSCPPTPGQSDKRPLHIPLALSLLARDGGEFELRMGGEGEAAPKQRVLDVTEPEQRFEFEDICERPVASLLRGFSAPVRLEMAESDEALAFRMAKDTDPFNRWEAAQTFALRVLQALVQDVQAERRLSLDTQFAKACRTTLVSAELDPALIVETLTLPSEDSLAETMTLADVLADVDAVHGAREFLRSALAEFMEQDLHRTYLAYRDKGAYSLDSAAVGRRSLKNICLAYLVASNKEDWTALAVNQFQQATNMTDTIAALRALVNLHGEARETALTAFYEKWQGEPLVIDKWFVLQATSSREDTLQRVRELSDHPAFDIKNPNRVRSLIGAFSMSNPVRFHQADGGGYGFLADKLLELDRLNPQVAARLVGAFSRWRKYDTGRQSLMRAQLERILDADGLSRDIYEVASKSLGRGSTN
jgi:aminopeptidase N